MQALADLWSYAIVMKPDDKHNDEMRRVYLWCNAWLNLSYRLDHYPHNSKGVNSLRDAVHAVVVQLHLQKACSQNAGSSIKCVTLYML